jgi:predicted MFS family arabinose efflux permease
LTTVAAGASLPQARRATWALFVVAFLSNVTIGARILIIPLYGSDLGLSAASIGLLYAVFAGVSALIAFPAGAMLDRSGSRRVMAAALMLVAVAQVLTMTRSIPVLAVSQALSGTAWTVSQLSIVTASISASQPRQIGRAIGLTALGGQTGLMAGPAIAGTLLQMIGFTNLILLSALPTLVALGIALVMVRDLDQRSQAGQEPPRTRDLLKNPAIRQIAVLAVAMGIVWGTFQAYFAIFASRGLHMPAVAIGWLIAIAALANASSRVPAGRLLTRVSRKHEIVAVSVFGFAAGLALLPHMRGFWQSALLLAVIVPLVSLSIMGMSVALAELGGTRGRGRALSIMYLVWNLASALAPAVLAPVMNNNFTVGFAAASLTAAGAAGVAVLMRRSETRRSSPTIGGL